MEISFLITICSDRCVKAASLLKKTAELLKSNNNTVRWKFVSVNYKCNNDEFDVIDNIYTDVDSSPYQHGLAINSGLSKMSGDVVVISDPDIAILYRNWDIVLLNSVLGKKTVFGIPYSGKTSHYKFQWKFHNFPIATFFAFDSNMVKDIVLDFLPKIEKVKGKGLRAKYIILNKKNAFLFGMKSGDRLMLDPGFKVVKTLNKNKFDAQMLIQKDFDSSEGVLQKYLCNDEYKKIIRYFDEKKRKFFDEFYFCDTIFLVHEVCGTRKADLHKIMENLVQKYILDNFEKKFIL